MLLFGGLLGLIGLATVVFRDADVVGLPATGVGIGMLVLGAAFAGLGLVRRTRRKRRIARGEPVPIGDIFDRARALPGLFRAMRTGAYADLPKSRMVLWGVAAVYLVSPIDVLPEFLPIIGIADDAGVAAWLLTSVSTAAGLYLRHERDRSQLPPT